MLSRSMWRLLLPVLFLLYGTEAGYFASDGVYRFAPYDDGYAEENVLNDKLQPENSDIIEQLIELQDPLYNSAYNEREQLSGEKIEKNEKFKEEKVQPMKAAKKGQNEFVELVEPKSPQLLKHTEEIEKRVPVTENRISHIRVPHGNALIISIGTVCIIATILGAVGGTYYFYTSRRLAAEKFDFTNYAPGGHGKEKKKKRGDEGLAYKAQLHHYQQTKQKIISGDEQGAGIPDQDETSEASDDDVNNFSVYECPGLAPTGDIEVQNPNFDSQQH